MLSKSIFLLFSYLFASIPFGLLVGRINGKDLRKEGSLNIGATNAWRVCGKKAGILTFLLDGLKGAIPVLLAKTFFEGSFFYIVGIIAILGHIFPVYLKFKGGRGVATTILILFAINPKIGLVAILIWALTFVLFGYSSLSSIVMSIVLIPFSAFYSGASGTYGLLIFNIIFTTLILAKHKENIQRLKNKSEKKLFKKAIF